MSRRLSSGRWRYGDALLGTSGPILPNGFNSARLSQDIAGELLERAFDADVNLSEDTKRFIDRHMTPGEKRPPAPSVRHDTGARHALRASGRKTGA
jgi:hypothetical protein